MTWMQDDLDERGNLWREFVGLVGDWFAEADFQPLSENHRDVLMAKHEAVLKFGAQKLHADDSHTAENFLAAVVTKDMSRCQRLWQPLVKQIAANHKMIADGIKPPTGPPADPKPDLTKADVPDSLRKLEERTPALDIKSADWIAAKKKNEKKFGVKLGTLSDNRSDLNGGRQLSWRFGVDNQGRTWRRDAKKTEKSTVYYWARSLKNNR